MRSKTTNASKGEKVGSCSLKLLSRNKKILKKYSNNNTKPKAMGYTLPIVKNYPRNEEMGDTDPQSEMSYQPR